MKHADDMAAAFDALAEGVIFVDTDGTILEMNPHALKLHGFASLAELIRNIAVYEEMWTLQNLDDLNAGSVF